MRGDGEDVCGCEHVQGGEVAQGCVRMAQMAREMPNMLEVRGDGEGREDV